MKLQKKRYTKGTNCIKNKKGEVNNQRVVYSSPIKYTRPYSNLN